MGSLSCAKLAALDEIHRWERDMKFGVVQARKTDWQLMGERAAEALSHLMVSASSFPRHKAAGLQREGLMP